MAAAAGEESALGLGFRIVGLVFLVRFGVGEEFIAEFGDDPPGMMALNSLPFFGPPQRS